MNLLFLLLLLVGCSREPAPLTHYKNEAMGIAYHVMLGEALTQSQQEEIEKCIDCTFQEIDLAYNNWNPASEVSRLAHLKEGEHATLSPGLAQLLYLVDSVYELTEGRFDPTIDPLQKIWREYLNRGETPPQELLEKISPAIGWKKIHLEGNQLWKEHSAITLDLGGISKGYCVDLLADRLDEAGYHNYYVEWGGEIRTSGSHPEGRPWRISLSGLTEIEMHEGAIATSGDYYQYWHVGEKVYFHIMDPYTQKPLQRTAQSIATVSVQAPSCALADGIATALMLFPTSEEASLWASQLENISCFIATHQ